MIFAWSKFNAVTWSNLLLIYTSVNVDGYDLFMAEMALKNGITQIITDDGDYATVSGLTVFTANQKVIQAASLVNKLISR